MERRVGSSSGTGVTGTRIGLRFGTGILGAVLVALSAASCGKRGSDAPSADSTGTTASTQSNAGGLRPPAAAAPAMSARSTVLFVGTSLTAGLGLEPDSAYPMLLQRKIDSAGLPFDVVNAGVSGETSSGLLDRLDWVLRGKFAVLVLETGANDGLRGIPPATLRTNLEKALDRIKAERPDVHVVLIQMEALPNLGPKYAADFHQVYPTVAKQKGVTLIPFLLAEVAGHRNLNQADGVHPNNEGERIVADNVWAGLMPVLKRVAGSGAQ